MVTRINLSISLPPAMVEVVDRACQLEHRTRSELVREALRLYLSLAPLDTPPKDRVAITRGYAAVVRQRRSEP